jgi:hypothetical protein
LDTWICRAKYGRRVQPMKRLNGHISGIATLRFIYKRLIKRKSELSVSKGFYTRTGIEKGSRRRQLRREKVRIEMNSFG